MGVPILEEYGHFLIKTHLKGMLFGGRGINQIIITIV